MHERLKGVPVYEIKPGQVDAYHYNHVQVALHRLSSSIRFPIPKLKHLDLILEQDAWIIVDRVQTDVPVAAWTEFEVSHRDNLHQPIACQIRTYHAHADMILERTLEAMELMLGERLSEGSLDEENIVAFEK